MARRYRVNIKPDEDGIFIATVPALPGVVEQGDTEDEAFENIGAAVRFTLDSMLEEGEDLPRSDAPLASAEARNNIELVV
jgi:predicted RNase H-like HicB family nuclease